MALRLCFGLTLICFVLIFRRVAGVLDCLPSDCKIFRASQEEHEVKSANVPSWNTFCYGGYKPSFFFLWINPVIKLHFNHSSPKKLFYIQKGSVTEIKEERNKTLPLLQVLQTLKALLLVNYNTEISFSAFNQSCIGVETDADYKVKFLIKTVEPWFVASLAVGVLLFISAKNWSRNTKLHYGTGVTVGILASIIILIIILHRLFPQSLKKLGYFFLVIGSSVSVYFMTVLVQYLYNPAINFLGDYWQWFLGYVVTTGLISFGICYRYGPVTDSKTLNLIQWFLQGLGLALIYNGTQIREMSVALVITTITLYNIPQGLFNNRITQHIRYKLFPPKIKLLTEEEYQEQIRVETRKALDQLREYCRSPECNTWKTVSRLQDPNRFASFIEGDEWHITDQELLDYDSGPEPTLPTDPDEDDDDDLEDMPRPSNTPRPRNTPGPSSTNGPVYTSVPSDTPRPSSTPGPSNTPGLFNTQNYADDESEVSSQNSSLDSDEGLQ